MKTAQSNKIFIYTQRDGNNQIRTIVRMKRRFSDVAKREIFRQEGRSMEVAQVCVQWQALVLVVSKLGVSASTEVLR